MGVKLNLEELIKIATNIELEGKKFYTQAAEYTTNQEAKKLFLELADWEETHYQSFNNLLSDSDSKEFEQIIDSMNEAALYLQAVLGGDIFSSSCSPRELANNNPESLDNIFRFAIDREKDSIIFYSSIEKVYANKDLLRKIDIIIGEEISHIRFLHATWKKINKI